MPKSLRKHIHFEGRREPLDVKHCHVESKNIRTYQGQPAGPTKPRTTPTPPTKDNSHIAKTTLNKELDFLHALLFPIPLNM